METVYETDLTSHSLLSPLSPQSPQTPPMSPPSPYQESYRKVNNPLIDLIETEKKYLKDLKCLLQQVTACWSNDDLPPPELDLMFRHVEVIYKQNKKFYLKLDKIGSNPASAKDLGETLLIWVDDMDDPYTNYVENFKLGFDFIPEIEENLSLQQTLNDISAEKNQPVSLDYFFDMPLKRLHYYKKLYLRLYRTTEPGRADNSLLLTANERIDRLLELEKKIKSSNKIKEFTSSTPAAENVVSSTVISSVSEDVSSVIVSPTIEIHQVEDSKKQNSIITNIPSINSQTIDSPVDPTVSTDKVQPVKKNWTLEELESQLDTSKTKDLFTKLPKIVKVSILSKDLPFERKIVLHDDFIIETTKSVNSTETHCINVHIFLLTDLLLICQEITQEEKQEEKVLKLIYPPFNTYHLSINDVNDDQEDSLELTILQKEMIILYANNKDTKDNWFREINKAIEISSNDPKSPKSNPRLSMISTTSMSSDALKRSPSVGNLINKDKSMRPVSTISQSVGNLINKDKSTRPVSSISQSPNLFPDFSSTDSPIIRSRTPDPPQNAGGQYPGDYLPSEQGKGQERHNSDPISSPSIRNKLTVGLQAERANSMASLVSVESIANFKETIFRSSACEVFIWINGVWKLLTKKDKCIVEVRLTVQNKGCWAILLESSNRMVLNAWVHSATTLHREDENSVSISCEIGQRVEYYKISAINSAESDQFNDCILKIKESAKELNVPAEKFISRSSSLQTIEPLREVEQTITQVMEVKCRVFLQNDHGVWTNIGWGNMKLSIETPSHRKRIIVNSDKKTKTIIDSIISEDGVEKIGKNSVALTLNNTGSNLRIIYLLRMKDEEMATKVFDVMKEKRKK